MSRFEYPAISGILLHPVVGAPRSDRRGVSRRQSSLAPPTAFPAPTVLTTRFRHVLRLSAKCRYASLRKQITVKMPVAAIRSRATACTGRSVAKSADITTRAATHRKLDRRRSDRCQRHVAVEHYPIHAVVAAGEQIAVAGAEAVGHRRRVGLGGASRSCPEGATDSERAKRASGAA